MAEVATISPDKWQKSLIATTDNKLLKSCATFIEPTAMLSTVWFATSIATNSQAKVTTLSSKAVGGSWSMIVNGETGARAIETSRSGNWAVETVVMSDATMTSDAAVAVEADAMMIAMNTADREIAIVTGIKDAGATGIVGAVDVAASTSIST